MSRADDTSPRLKPLREAPRTKLASVTTLFSDLDDTLTSGGMLTADAYGALGALAKAKIAVVILTGRPAGWCDLMARLWPVAGVVGENGAFYFRYERGTRRMHRVYARSAADMRADRKRLDALAERILSAVPGSALAADQAFRIADLAIDYREDVAPLGRDAVKEIVRLFEAAGAQAKVSSIHVNGWFGTYDKLSMARRFAADQLAGWRAEAFAFIGDSPNDAPLFTALPCSIGVANLQPFAAQMTDLPAYITDREGGDGFVELAQALLDAR